MIQKVKFRCREFVFQQTFTPFFIQINYLNIEEAMPKGKTMTVAELLAIIQDCPKDFEIEVETPEGLWEIEEAKKNFEVDKLILS